MPYYLAIQYKQQLARKLLEEEIEKNFMEQDQGVVNKQFAAQSFNEGLLQEMDAEAKIPDKDILLDKLAAAYEQIVREHLEKRKGVK